MRQDRVRFAARHGKIWLLTLCWYAIQSAPASAVETVQVGVFENHFRYTDAADSYGLSWELLVAAAASRNLRIEVQELSWKASLQRLRANKLDLVFGAFYSEERAAWATFSHPLIADSSAIFTSLDSPAASLDDIDFNHQVIGVTRQSVQEGYAREMGFKNIYSAVERKQLYSMLQQKRIDYLFFGTNIINYYCLYVAQERNKGCMKQVGPNLKSNFTHAISSLDSPKGRRVIFLINQGLEELLSSEKGLALFRSKGFSEQARSQWRSTVNAAINR